MGGWQSMFGVISGRLPNCVTQAAVATYFRGIKNAQNYI